jgi:hypothetical protein
MPKQGLLFTKKDFMLVPFSLFWCGFAVFWESNVVTTPNAPLFMKLWGIPFVVIGLYVLFGRFFLDASVRARTHYAVTDKRILILRSGWFHKFFAVQLDTLPGLNIEQSSDGSGTIVFAQSAGNQKSGMDSWAPSLSKIPQFFAVPDVRHVLDLIENARATPSRY